MIREVAVVCVKGHNCLQRDRREITRKEDGPSGTQAGGFSKDVRFLRDTGPTLIESSTSRTP